MRVFYGVPLYCHVVDTMALAQRAYQRQARLIPEGTLRLTALRKAYHLPQYQGHDALFDLSTVFATIEEFMFI